MATFTNWGVLEKLAQSKMNSTMQSVDRHSKMKALENADEFYTQGKPKRYKRTGKYGDAPESTGVIGSGNKLEVDIYMNPNNHGYQTGTFSAQEVWQAAETGSAGVLGLPGRWEQTKNDVEDIINEEFGKRFSK